MIAEIKKFFKQDFKEAIIIGIAIALFYTFTFQGDGRFNVLVLILTLSFGIIVSCTISLVNFTSESLLLKFKFYQQYFILRVIKTFFFSAIVFYLIGRLFRYPFPELMPDPYLLNASLGVGIISVMVAIVYYAIDKEKEATRLEKKNKELAVLEERNRIARELHDSVSQNLFGVNLQLNTLNKIVEDNPKQARKIIDQSQEMVQEVQTEMRLMIYELRPVNLKEKDFLIAVADLIKLYRKRYNLEIKSKLAGDEDSIDNKLQFAIYRVLQEALNNIVKHAKAEMVELELLIKRPQGVKLKVKDDGQGFNPSRDNEGIGLLTMRERIEKVSGKFKLDSKLGKGTTIIVIV